MPVVAGYDPRPSDHVRVEVAFSTAPDDPSPAWVDLTSRLDLTSPVSITRGRTDEFSVIQPSSCQLTLDNSDGALTAGNAGSVFYPNVLPHRKIRVSYRTPGVGGNLLAPEDASFEAGTTGAWGNGFFGATPCTIANSSTRAHHGSRSMLVTWPTASLSGAQLSATVVKGRTYTVSARVWVPSGSPAVKFGCHFLGLSAASSTTDAWVTLSATVVADTNTLFIGPETAASSTAGQQVWVDSIRLDEGADASAFTLDAPPIQYRFTGYVEEWPCEWPGGNAYSQVQITAVDKFSRIGAKRSMRSIIEEALLADAPFFYYPLGEPEASTKGGDVAGTSGVTPVSVVQVGAGGTLDFGTATGPPTDALPAPTFTPVNVTNGKYLAGTLPNLGFSSLGFTNSITLRASFLTSTSADQTMVRVSDLYGSYAEIGISAAGKATATLMGAFSGGVAGIAITSATTFANGNTHDAELILSQSGGTIAGTLRIDGASVGTGSTAAASLPVYTAVQIGGVGGGRCFNGVICHVAAYTTALTAAQSIDHNTATTTGYEGDTSNARIARYATWAGISAADMVLDAGSSTSICFTDTTDQSVLQAMQDVAQTEGGRLFINGAGQLVFHARSRTYLNAAAKASVDAHMLGQDARFSISTQNLVNDMTGKRPTGPDVRAFDAASIATYGVASQSVTLLVTSDTEVADAVNWRVQGAKDPQVRLPQGRFDLYTDPTGYQAQLRSLELGDRITVTGLPVQAPAPTVDLIVEGYTETIGLTGWDLTANLSNYTATQALVLDDAVYGLLDGANRLVY